MIIQCAQCSAICIHEQKALIQGRVHSTITHTVATYSGFHFDTVSYGIELQFFVYVLMALELAPRHDTRCWSQVLWA